MKITLRTLWTLDYMGFFCRCYSYEGQIGGGQSLSMQAYGCMSVRYDFKKQQEKYIIYTRIGDIY